MTAVKWGMSVMSNSKFPPSLSELWQQPSEIAQDEKSWPGFPIEQVSSLGGYATAGCVWEQRELCEWLPRSQHLRARVLPEGSRDGRQSLSSQSNKKLFLSWEAGRHIKDSLVEGYLFLLLPTLDPAHAILQGWEFLMSLRWNPGYLLFCKAWKMCKLFFICSPTVIQRDNTGKHPLCCV